MQLSPLSRTHELESVQANAHHSDEQFQLNQQMLRQHRIVNGYLAQIPSLNSHELYWPNSDEFCRVLYGHTRTKNVKIICANNGSILVHKGILCKYDYFKALFTFEDEKLQIDKLSEEQFYEKSYEVNLSEYDQSIVKIVTTYLYTCHIDTEKISDSILPSLISLADFLLLKKFASQMELLDKTRKEFQRIHGRPVELNPFVIVRPKWTPTAEMEEFYADLEKNIIKTYLWVLQEGRSSDHFLQYLRQDNPTKDCTIICAQTPGALDASRELVLVHSEMLPKDTTDGQSQPVRQIDLSEYSKKTVELLVDYIYFRTLWSKELRASLPTIQALSSLADRFSLKYLKEECEKCEKYLVASKS